MFQVNKNLRGNREAQEGRKQVKPRCSPTAQFPTSANPVDIRSRTRKGK